MFPTRLGVIKGRELLLVLSSTYSRVAMLINSFVNKYLLDDLWDLINKKSFIILVCMCLSLLSHMVPHGFSKDT